jgi:hypothetical protein
MAPDEFDYKEKSPPNPVSAPDPYVDEAGLNDEMSQILKELDEVNFSEIEPSPAYPDGDQSFTPQNQVQAHYNPASDETDPDRANQGYADPDRANQGYADPDQANQGYADPDRANQGFADQDYTNPVYTSQSYADPDQASQGYADQDYSDQVYTDQDYADPVYTNQGYVSPVNTNQGYADPGHTSQGYTNQAHNQPGYGQELPSYESPLVPYNQGQLNQRPAQNRSGQPQRHQIYPKYQSKIENPPRQSQMTQALIQPSHLSPPSQAIQNYENIPTVQPEPPNWANMDPDFDDPQEGQSQGYLGQVTQPSHPTQPSVPNYREQYSPNQPQTISNQRLSANSYQTPEPPKVPTTEKAEPTTELFFPDHHLGLPNLGNRPHGQRTPPAQTQTVEANPKPTVLTARHPVPVPRAPAEPASGTLLLTEILEVVQENNTEVIDLVDAVDQVQPLSSSGQLKVIDLTADELAQLIESAMERALKKVFKK